jgi:S1-C subfamily serine protease
MTGPARRRALAIPFLALAVGIAPRGGACAEETAASVVLARRAPSIVHVKYVLKSTFSFGGQSQENESRRELAGVLVDETGLVMVSASFFGSRSTSWMKASASDLKVVFGTDPKEHEAVLVAQDTNVDLAFVKVLDLEGRAVTPVDLSKGGEVRIGMPLFQVMRKDASFDFAPVVGTGYVTARVEKPRPLWGLAGDARFPGLPLYDATGAVLGIVTRQWGAEGGEEGGGRASGTFLLPLDAVGKALAEARKRVPEAVEKAKSARSADPVPPQPPPSPSDEPVEPEKPR